MNHPMKILADHMSGSIRTGPPLRPHPLCVFAFVGVCFDHQSLGSVAVSSTLARHIQRPLENVNKVVRPVLYLMNHVVKM